MNGRHPYLASLELAITDKNPRDFFRLVKLINSHGELSLALPNEQGETVLTAAIKTRSFALGRELLRIQNYNAAMFQGDLEGRTPFWYAAQEGDNTFFDELIAALHHPALRQPIPNACFQPDKEGVSPLHVAVNYRNPYILRALLKEATLNEKEQFNRVNQTDKAGATPLHYACRKRCVDGIALLIEAGASWVVCNNEGVSPFTYYLMMAPDMQVRVVSKLSSKQQRVLLEMYSPLIKDVAGHHILKNLFIKASGLHSLQSLIKAQHEFGNMPSRPCLPFLLEDMPRYQKKISDIFRIDVNEAPPLIRGMEMIARAPVVSPIAFFKPAKQVFELLDEDRKNLSALRKNVTAFKENKEAISTVHPMRRMQATLFFLLCWGLPVPLFVSLYYLGENFFSYPSPYLDGLQWEDGYVIFYTLFAIVASLVTLCVSILICSHYCSFARIVEETEWESILDKLNDDVIAKLKHLETKSTATENYLPIEVAGLRELEEIYDELQDEQTITHVIELFTQLNEKLTALLTQMNISNKPLSTAEVNEVVIQLPEETEPETHERMRLI